jgi:hypothetical protein
MQERERHEMVLNATHASGAEEWLCPTCGRRFLLQWPPDYKKIVLNSGDESALHTGGKGEERLDVSERAHEATEDVADERLQPWLTWMDSSDFDRLWTQELIDLD